MYFNYNFLIFILLYIIISLHSQLLAQSAVTVDFHDQSTETYHLSASGKIVSEDSFLKILTDSNAPIITIPFTTIRKISFTSLSSSDEKSSTAGIKVFPNPADQYIMITNDPGNSPEISLTNITGQPVFSGKFTNGERISVSHLKPGLYLAKINHQILRLIIQ